MKIETIDLDPETPEAKAALVAADASLATTPPTQEEMSWFRANRHPGGFNSESSDGELITMEDGRKYLRYPWMRQSDIVDTIQWQKSFCRISFQVKGRRN